jgi:DNA-binding winged helix-turn-helix (wHTH) protein
MRKAGILSPFQPTGKQARWRVAYELLQAAEVGAVVTYDELGEALGLDSDSDRHAIQMAIRRAAQELEEQDKRAIDAVTNKGYRIVEAPEHLVLARRHHRKAGRSLARGHSKAVNVDLTGVDPEVRRALELTAQAFSLQMDFNRRFAVRQSQLEQAVREITDTQATDRRRSADDIAMLRDRIERLEREREK